MITIDGVPIELVRPPSGPPPDRRPPPRGPGPVAPPPPPTPPPMPPRTAWVASWRADGMPHRADVLITAGSFTRLVARIGGGR